MALLPLKDRRCVCSYFAAQAAGLRLTENMKISFEKEQGNNGKYSAVNLQAAE